MNRMNGFHCFDLNHDLVLHQDVNPIATLRTHALVFDGNGYLASEGYAAKLQLAAKALFINGLQKTRPRAR